MRLGLYLGRHAGAGGGIGVYVREMVRGICRRAAVEQVSVVLYGDRSILTDSLRSELVQLFGSGFGGKGQLTVRMLPSGLGYRAGFLIDQVLLPVLAVFDGLSGLHSLANISGVAVMGARFPNITTIHDLFQGWPPVGLRSPDRFSPRSALFRFLLKRGASGSTLCLTDCAQVADELSWRVGVESSRTRCVPLGLDDAAVSFLATLEDRSGTVYDEFREMLSRSGLPSQYILLFGSADPRKKVALAIDAWASIPPMERLPLIVTAPDDAAEQTVRSRSRSDLPLYVIRGWQSRERLLRLLAGAKIFLSPVIEEGFGLPAYEALALGVTVVSGPLGFVPPTMGAEERPALFCVNPNDVKDLSGALGAAMRSVAPTEDNEWLPTRFKLVGSVQWRSKFRPMMSVVEDTWKIYQELGCVPSLAK